MGKITGFLEIDRLDRTYDKPQERIRTYREFVRPLGGTERRAAWIAAFRFAIRAVRSTI